ncbi:MAG: nuclear transport factor 2 family protein [Hyphomonadaceae bacterium]|nr:nuclear transport factor 2 family protein [Hyphomonadaceae bacterium]
MSLDLPNPIGAYFAAKNAHDIDAMLAPFAEDAHVRDEGRDYNGHAAIRAWMEETTRKYRVTVTPEEITTDGARLTIRALVSGDFPGSPAYLTYRFVGIGDRITDLEIG